jgi:hypothetical protein
MMRFLSILLLLILASGVPGATDAAQDLERVPVRITAVSGRSVYLDRGRSEGIEPGDTVRILPLGGVTSIAIVRSVSRGSARAELEGGEVEIEIGAEGEVLVPGERRRAASETPDHPDWEHPPVDWDEEMPLLAPVFGREPEERDRRVRGRLHTQYHTTTDHGSGDREYTRFRTGADLTFENPFRRGGELELDLELYRRTAETDDGDDESEGRLSPDKVSYRWGGVRGRPHRFEIGRFLQREFPEFGIIDGVEYGRRLRSGSRWGASVGWLPSRDDELRTGEDLQTSLFYRFVSGEEETLALGAGYQKTWHKGEADRDLLVGTFDYHPTRRLSARVSAEVDYYTSSDELKSSGPELTQLLVNGSYRWESGNGVGIFATHFRWPELLRNEFDDLTALQISDHKTTRIGMHGWRRLSDAVRLNARLDRWSDQDDSGGSGDLRVSLRDLLFDDGEVSVGIHQISGKYSDGLGVRVRADRRFSSGHLGLSWDGTNFEPEGPSGSAASLQHHTLRANYDWSIGSSWSLSLFVENRLGDEQDSLTAGFFLQKRL